MEVIEQLSANSGARVVMKSPYNLYGYLSAKTIFCCSFVLRESVAILCPVE
jgi:hypothetical protein